jgi:hypothetical protein
MQRRETMAKPDPTDKLLDELVAGKTRPSQASFPRGGRLGGQRLTVDQPLVPPLLELGRELATDQ